MTKRNRLASADGQKVLMRGSAIVVANYIIFAIHRSCGAGGAPHERHPFETCRAVLAARARRCASPRGGETRLECLETR